MTAPRAAHARMINRRQSAKLHILFAEMHVTDRGERLARVGRYLGKEITSTSELSQDEASIVIDWLVRGGE